MDVTRATYCADCKKRMARGRIPKTACKTCERREPRLLHSVIPIVTLWDACHTQWRRDNGMYYGLDYPALYLVAKSLGIDVDRLVFSGIRLLERITLDALRKDTA